jgi:hypothetical protein
VRQWGSRAKDDLVLVLNAKGGEIKAKARNGSVPPENFENSRVELLFYQILLLSLFVKSWSLVGRMFDYGKKGEFFESLINFSWNTSLCLNK